MTELENEISQLVSPGERMLLEYEIRFWKQKAWRAEQQRDRAELARKEAEDIAEKYKSIPQTVLDRVLLDIKMAELAEVKNAALVHMPSIGLTNFRRLNTKADLLENIDAKIKMWKDVVNNHRAYEMVEDE
jgi:hypothetical protein